MLSRKFRLPANEIKLGGRNSASTPHLSVRFSTNGLPHNRFAFIISNKTEKKASARHYFKRRLSEGVRSWPNLNMDIIIVVRLKLGDTKQDVLKEEAGQALKKILKKRNQ